MKRTDSPRPDDAQLPVHLYTHQDFHPDDQNTFDPNDSLEYTYGQDDYPETINQDQNDLLEEYDPYDPYYHQNSDSNQTPLDPTFHHNVTSEDERRDYFDPNWQQHYREPSVDLSTPDLDPFYNNAEYYNDHAGRPNSPNSDYYHEDRPYAEYYDDGEDQATSETYYDVDRLENAFKRLDLQPEGHSANKATFFHRDINQDFHVNCRICDGYIENFYNRHSHLDEFHDYNDGTSDYYNWTQNQAKLLKILYIQADSNTPLIFCKTNKYILTFPIEKQKKKFLIANKTWQPQHKKKLISYKHDKNNVRAKATSRSLKSNASTKDYSYSILKWLCNRTLLL